MLAEQIRHQHPGFRFLQHPDDLLFGETTLLHSSSPSGLGRPV